MSVASRNEIDAWPDCQQTSQQRNEVSIVMPCLNEAETLDFCIREAQQALTESGIEGDILVADNGSTDGSQQIARNLGATVVEVSAKGYGNALRGGILASTGNFVVIADADGSYNLGHLPRFVEKLREGYDLVMGNRFQGGIEPGAMPWKHRYIGNPLLTAIGRIFFRSPVGDFHCGLRGFRRDAFEQMSLTTSGMEFASEMVIKATLKGMQITEVPTVLRPDGRSRPPHLRSWRDGWRHLQFMLLYSPRWLFITPGIALVAAGLLMMLVIAVYFPLRVSGVELNVNTSMGSAMIAILGYQLLIAGVFTRYIGSTFGTLPPSRTLKLFQERLSLEHGVVAGLVIILVGLGLFSAAFFVWSGSGFGELSPSLTVQCVIPAMTLAVVGAQTVAGSFFVNALRLTIKDCD